mmetsp:Transcript_22284/g.37765  ORF Transcript_22284/g.37765 Transcript_22284/m.37765 type:complete len:96 (+) Transcript_22284:753-1040(+)
MSTRARITHELPILMLGKHLEAIAQMQLVMKEVPCTATPADMKTMMTGTIVHIWHIFKLPRGWRISARVRVAWRRSQEEAFTGSIYSEVQSKLIE